MSDDEETLAVFRDTAVFGPRQWFVGNSRFGFTTQADAENALRLGTHMAQSACRVLADKVIEVLP